MTNPISGLVIVAGEHDTGKTNFALSCGYQPAELFIVDDDKKTAASLQRLGMDKFPFYRDMVRRTDGLREIGVHEYGLSIIEEIAKVKPPVVIWDTWSRFAKTCHPYVAKNPGKFREVWSPMGEIKGAEQWQAAFAYESSLIGRILDSAKLVIFTTHLKSQRIGRLVTGKQVPDVSKSVDAMATLRLWLLHNPKSPKPIGLVLKRIEKWEQTGKGLKPISVLPQRLEPGTWETIFNYWDNPVGDRELRPEEKPNAFELSIIENTLTPEQREVFKLAATAEEDAAAMVIEEPVEEKPPETVGQFLARLKPEDESYLESIQFDLAELKQKDVPGLWQKIAGNRNGRG